MKTTISRGRNDNFDSRGCKFIMEDFSSGENEKKNSQLDGTLPHPQGFAQWFRGIMGYNLGDSLTGHYFVLQDLIRMSFFKLVMIL